MKKIGFIYINKTYCVYHSISIAIELAKINTNKIEILCTEENEKLVTRVLKVHKVSNISINILRPYWYFTIPHYLEIKFQLRPILFLKYKLLLSAFDALVCTIYQDLDLKKFLTKDGLPKFIFTNHGIPNRAYSFDEKVLQFDLSFLLGDKDKHIRKNLGQLKSSNFKVTGFIKGDVTKELPQAKLFNNKNPTILYNPHWERGLSSYFNFGEGILSFFESKKNYNLIFAPHALLLARNWKLKSKLKRFSICDNIEIDFGSESSNDMSYTKAADFYLGDVSSQAMEYVFHEKRPCIFLDAFEIRNDSKEKPLSWELGNVYTSIDNLGEILNSATVDFKTKYSDVQSKLIEETFYFGESKPSYLAAMAIEDLLQ